MTTCIGDLHDARLQPYRDLRHRDDADGFIAEGHVVVRRLIDMGVKLHSLLLQSGARTDYLDRVAPDVPVYKASKSLLEEVVGYPFHRGVLAHGPVPDRRDFDSWLEDRRPALSLALFGLSDAENVGSLLRSAAAMGVRDILIGPGTISPFVRRALRVSMASSLMHRLVVMEDPARQVEILNRIGTNTIATSLRDDAEEWSVTKWSGDHRPIVLMLGNEASGLPDDIQSASSYRVRLPMHRDVDSLNVAVAGAIFMHDLTTSIRQRTLGLRSPSAASP
ncbi:MAG: RNA methyltransferase [Planctomycetota bacterium]